jgi:hypothetical protein
LEICEKSADTSQWSHPAEHLGVAAFGHVGDTMFFAGTSNSRQVLWIRTVTEGYAPSNLLNLDDCVNCKTI